MKKPEVMDDYLRLNKCDELNCIFYSSSTNNIDETMLECALAHGIFSHKVVLTKLITAADIDREVEKIGFGDDIIGYRLYKYITTVDVSEDDAKDIYLITTYYLNK